MSPCIALMPLGKRMRELMPRGHALSEFLIACYGRPMYALALVIMLFYMLISMAAELTAMAALVRLIALVPLWLSATIVLGFTLVYAVYGGLKASILTCTRWRAASGVWMQQ